MSLELEDQIRRVADAAFDQTTPVRLDRAGPIPVAEPMSSRSRWILLAAAGALVALGVGALVVLRGPADDPLPAVDTGVDGTASPTGPPTVSDTATRDTRATLEPAPDFSDAFSARGVLAEIPVAGFDPQTGLIVEASDLSVLAALAGVERTASDDPLVSATPWVDLVAGDRSVALADSFLFYDTLREPAAFDEELGFGFLDVDRYATASNFLGFDLDELSSFAFPFDVFALRSASARLVGAAGPDGIVDIGEGPDGDANLDESTPIRPVGQPLRVGVEPDSSMIAVTQSTSFVTTWLAAERETVVDDDDFATAAAVLDRVADTYTVRFDAFDRNLGGPAAPPANGFSESDYAITEPFTTVALGWSGTGDAQRTTIVYVFADVQAAGASVEPIAGLYAPGNRTSGDGADTVGDVLLVDEVTADGRSVVVTGRTAPDARARDVVGILSPLSPLSTHLAR